MLMKRRDDQEAKYRREQNRTERNGRVERTEGAKEVNDHHHRVNESEYEHERNA